jgi:hypothetical protein
MEDTAVAKKIDIAKCKMIKINDDVYLLHNESGKLVKPHDHEKVDLSDLLEN